MISCILLSAGESSRFGSPKALVRIGGLPNIQKLINKAISTSISDLIIVLGADSHLIQPMIFKHSKIQIVHNNDYYLGQLSSLQIGLKACPKNSAGFMVLPVDYPFVLGETFEMLIDRFLESKRDIIIPTFNGQRGHPPVFSAQLMDQILRAPQSEKLSNMFLLSKNTTQLVEVPDKGIILTFNTPAELHWIVSQNPHLR